MGVKWVRVGKQIPGTDLERVLVVDGGGEMFTMSVADRQWTVSADRDVLITHWMPLPEPPND